MWVWDPRAAMRGGDEAAHVRAGRDDMRGSIPVVHFLVDTSQAHPKRFDPARKGNRSGCGLDMPQAVRNHNAGSSGDASSSAVAAACRRRRPSGRGVATSTAPSHATTSSSVLGLSNRIRLRSSRTGTAHTHRAGAAVPGAQVLSQGLGTATGMAP
jgi:hypothetical protein